MWEPFLMTPTSTRRKIGIGISYFLDVIICLAVISWISVVELGVTPHSQQGFYCNDTSISHEYNGDTITVTLLFISSFIPIIFMWLTEFLSIHNATFTSSGAVSPTSTTLPIKISMKSAIWECTDYIKYYMIGMLGKLVIVETIKIIFGELRPHFLHTCKPDALKDCNNNGLYYIKKYSCTGYNEFGTILVTDSSRSFPSGHSSVSFYQAIFMIWYLQERFPKTQSIFVLPFIQCLCVCWAFICGLTRITDHRHHWWDVLAGSIFGVIFSVFTCTVFCKKFKKIKQSSSIINNTTDIIIPNQNGSTVINCNNHNHHTSIKRLISDTSVKEEVTLNNVTMA